MFSFIIYSGREHGFEEVNGHSILVEASERWLPESFLYRLPNLVDSGRPTLDGTGRGAVSESFDVTMNTTRHAIA